MNITVCYIETKACAFDIAVPRFLEPAKGIEEPVHIFFLNADTRITYSYKNGLFAVAIFV